MFFVLGRKIRQAWTVEEMARLKGLIQASVLSRKPPTKRDIEEIEVNRDWLSVKYRVWAEAQLQIKKIDVQKKKIMLC